MLNRDVRNKLSEKREYDIFLLKDFLRIYLLLLLMPGTEQLRVRLKKFYDDNVIYSKIEREILKEIKKCEKEDLIEFCKDMIDEMDEIFSKLFRYNEWIIQGYFDAINTGDFLSATIPNKNFDLLDEDRKLEFIKKIR